MDFDEIFEQYFDRIYYKILGVVKNPEDAEDISQEVFISVYKNLKNSELTAIYILGYIKLLSTKYMIFSEKGK